MVDPPGALMPDFEITSPDGRKFVVTAPEGASQDDVLRYAQQNMPERGLGEQVMRGVAFAQRGINNAAGATIGALPDLVTAGLRGADKLVSMLRPEGAVPALPDIPLPKPGFYTEKAQGALNALGRNDTPETSLERNILATGEGVGNAASFLLPAGAIGAVAKSGSMTGNIARQLASQPVTQLVAGGVGGSVGQTTDSPLAGVAASLGTGVAMNAPRLLAGARTGVMNPEETRLRGVFTENGVPLTPGQATQSGPLRSMESVFRKLPMTAGPQERVAQTQREAYNRYWLKQAGSDADLATPTTIQGLRDRWGGTIGDIAERNKLTASQGFVDDVKGIMDEAVAVLPNGTEKPIIARAKSILAKVGQDGTIPGSTYRAFDTELGKAIKETMAPDVKSRLGDLRARVREAMDASISPDDAATWKEARRGYAITMAIKEAMDSGVPMAARGNIPPTQISRTMVKNYGRGFGSDTSTNRDMAAAGRLFIGDNIPDPGTANQLFYQNLATGGLAGGAGLASGADLGTMALTSAGLLGIPRGLQALYNSQAGRNYMTQRPGEYLPGLLNIPASQSRTLLDR